MKAAVYGIRDAEIETFLHNQIKPIFKSAGLETDNIKIHLIADTTPNAFITNGQHVFVHVGLFLTAENENEIAGVLAHETGHIKGGHLSRLANKIKSAQTASIVGMALGMLALFGGEDSAGVGMATMMTVPTMAEKELLSYSREEERMADEIGLQLLEKTNKSGSGLLTFMEKLGKQQDMTLSKNISPYNLSHPLSQERVSYIQQRLKSEKKTPISSKEFDFIKAKLTGYFRPNDLASTSFKNKNLKDYATTFAFIREKNFSTALSFIEPLTKTLPQNGFIWETYGQVLFGLGKIKETQKAYEKSKNLTHNHPLIELEYITCATEDPTTDFEKLIDQTKLLLLQEPSLVSSYKTLAILYGKKNKTGLKYYALTEYAFAQKNKKETRKQLEKAEKELDKTTPEYLRLMDIKNALETDDD